MNKIILSGVWFLVMMVGLTFFLPSSYAYTVNQSNLVFEARFEGNLNDESQYKNNGTNGGGLYNGTGIIGSAWTSNDEKDHANFTDTGNPQMKGILEHNFVMWLWVKNEVSASRWTNMFNYGTADGSACWELTINNPIPTKTRWYFNNRGTQFTDWSPDIEQASGLDFITIVSNNSDIQIFINGTMVKSSTMVPFSCSVGAPMRIGAGWGGDHFWTGLIDELVLLNNTVLTEAEIDEIYNDYSTGSRPTEVTPSDTDLPYFLHVLENFSISTVEAVTFFYDINATDITGNISTFSVNDTNFTINNTGYLTMNAPYTADYYSLNISINDTSDNRNHSIMFINVSFFNDTTAPFVELISPANESLQLSPFTITFNVTDDGTDEQLCQLTEFTTSYTYEPIAIYRFEQVNTSTVLDSGYHSNTGDVIDNAFTTESSGTNDTGSWSRQFDGVNDYINISNSNYNFSFGDSVDDDPFSMCAWLYMHDATGFRIMGTQNAGAPLSIVEYSLFTDSSDALRIQLYDDDTLNLIGRKTDNGNMTDLENRWIHVCSTYDGTSALAGLKLYVDGFLVDTTDIIGGSYTAMHQEAHLFGIGVNNPLASPSVADGLIDEVGIYSFELTQEQVNIIIQEGVINESITTIYDSGLFGQDQDVYINYSGSLPNDFDLTCYDNSANNNSYSLGLYYDTDAILPVLTVNLPLNNSVYSIDISNVTINASCTDANYDKINVSLYNSSEVFFSNSSTTNDVTGTFNVTGVSEGSYNVEFNCYDTVGNNAYEILDIEFTESPFPVITLDEPADLTTYDLFYEDFPLFINFTFNVSKNSNCSLYLDSVLNDTIQAYNVSLQSFENTPFDNSTGTVSWRVNCNDSTFVTMSEERSFTVTASFPPTIHQDLFGVGQCPDSLVGALLIAIMLGAVIALIVYSEIADMMILNFLAVVMIWVLAWILSGCSYMFGLSLGLSGIAILTRGITKVLSD